MKVSDFGLTVTAIEVLAYLVPGMLFLWGVRQIDPGLLPPSWPVTTFDSLVAFCLVVVLGVVLQEVGHVLKAPYDHLYVPLHRGGGDRYLEEARRRMGKQAQGSSAYSHAMSALRNAGRPTAHIEIDEGLSKLFRALTVGSLIFVFWFAQRGDQQAASLACLAAILAFYIHCRLRLQAATTLYQAYIQWHAGQRPK